ncbi:unnamed protein product, partial [Ixodes pacificus]
MQEGLVVALQQLFPRTPAGGPTHPDTTQGAAGISTAPTNAHQQQSAATTYPTSSQGPSGYTLQAALGGYDAAPAAQAAAFGQPPTQPPFQTSFGAPHPFPPPTPVNVPVYGQATPKQRIFTVHDLPTRRDLGEEFIHVQNANQSSQLLSLRDIIELQLLEAFLEVWDSYPPPPLRPKAASKSSTEYGYSTTWPPAGGTPPSTAMRTPAPAISSVPQHDEQSSPNGPPVPPAQERIQDGRAARITRERTPEKTTTPRPGTPPPAPPRAGRGRHTPDRSRADPPLPEGARAPVPPQEGQPRQPRHDEQENEDLSEETDSRQHPTRR